MGERTHKVGFNKLERTLDMFDFANHDHNVLEIEARLTALQQARQAQLLASRRKMDAIVEAWKEHRVDTDLDKKEGSSQIGYEREDFVAGVVRQLPYVRSVRQSIPNSISDRKGKDLTVILHREDCYFDLSFSSVFVQVKSSNEGMALFKRKIKTSNNIAWQEIDQMLLFNRYILINGNRPVARVVEQFETQLDSMVQFHNELK